MTAVPLSRWARIARNIARFELVLGAFAWLTAGPLPYVVGPPMRTPMFAPAPSEFVPAVGLGLATVGFLWMLRIYRDATRV